MAKDQNKSQKLKSSEYEKLGRLLVSIGETGYHNKKEFYKMTFLKGVISGFGGVVGATLVVTLLLFVLSLAGSIPFVGGIADTIRNSINS